MTLKVWMAADYIDTEPIRALIEDFQRAYPNITIETRSGVLWENMTREVELAISRGDPPDVAHGHAFAFGAQGMAEPLDDLWQTWNAENEFLTGAIEDVIWKGHHYGMPLDINAVFTIYNRRMLREAGLAPPSERWTFDDFAAMSERLTKPDGSRYGTALTTNGWLVAGLIFADGGDLLAERDGKIVATLDDPSVRRIIELHRRMGLTERTGSLPPPTLRQTDHPVSLFKDQRVAMFFSGPWDLAVLRSEAPDLMADVGTAPLPRGQGQSAGGSVQGGGSLFVPRGAKHREAAFEFMKWAVAKPYALRLATELGRYPTKSAYYDVPELQNDPLLLPFYEQLRRARPYKLEAYLNANTLWSDAVKRSLEPNTDVEQLLRDTQQQMQTAIDEVEAANP